MLFGNLCQDYIIVLMVGCRLFSENSWKTERKIRNICDMWWESWNDITEKTHYMGLDRGLGLGGLGSML